MSKLAAYAQLLRLPNLFTAIADPLAGWLIVCHAASLELGLTLATSACLYSAGMVLNDCADYAADCRFRPERPLPRGSINRKTAWILGILLIPTGLTCAYFVGPVTLCLAGLITLAVLLYNFWLKSTLFGPSVLGICRALNLLLGMYRLHSPALWPAFVLGSYVTVLSFIARQEELRPAVRGLVKQLLLGIIVVDAGLVVVCTGNWPAAALVLSLLVPAVVLGKLFAMT